MLNILFRRRKKADDEEIPGIYEGKEEEVKNIAQPVVNEQLTQLSDTLSQLSSTIRNIEQRTRDISEKIDAIEEKINVHEKEIENLKNTSEKMFMLYDVIAKSYNPFIEEESKPSIVQQPEEKSISKVNTDILPLDKISKDPSFIAVIMGWLHYLVTKSNIEEVEKAIEYYESIGWITEEVKIELLKYLAGFKHVQTENFELLPEDHLVSLYIITKLKDGLDRGIVKFSELYREMIEKGIIKPIR